MKTSKEELNEDNKGTTVLKSKMVKSIKTSKEKKATVDHNIPADLLKDLEEIKIMTIVFYCF